MTVPRDHVTGVLLAAGRSRRMGEPKLLLSWPPGGPSTVIASAFDAIAPSCARMIVVVGDDPASLARALGDRRHDTVDGEPDGDMLASARRGLAAAVRAAHGDGAPPRWIMLHPADHPTVGAGTVAALFDRASSSPRALAVVPDYAGRGGHPAVIAVDAVAEILAWRGEGGLAGFWRHRGPEVVRVPVADPSVVVDLDTPAGYRRAADGRSGAR